MKLYWRFKKNGKWTWKAADTWRNGDDYMIVDELEEEE